MEDRATSPATPALQLPILPLDGKVLFPRTYLRLAITSASALQLLKDLVWEVRAPKTSRRSGSDSAASTSLTLAIFTRRSSAERDAGSHQVLPTTAEAKDAVYSVGTVARVVQLTRMQGGVAGLSVLVQGLHRVQLQDVAQTRPYLVGSVQQLEVPAPVKGEKTKETALTLEQLALRLKHLTQEYLETAKSAPLLRRSNGLVDAIGNSSAGELADVVVSYLNVAVDEKQQVLEAVPVALRCELAVALLEQETEKARLQRKIQSEVQDKLEGTRKKFLLRQQLEAIKKELGEAGDDGAGGENASDIKLLEDRLNALNLEPKAAKVAQRELRRLKGMTAMQPEYGILHNYLEFFSELPWNASTTDSLLVERVRKQLDADHYGLDKVKKRITEYIAVRSLKRDMRGPILCLVGPPGVGKTSLGRSIAAATNRKFERVALGGVHDESEIRGHRKTYVGAMPGCILNALRHAETNNPVLLLDEVDKLGKDFRGDPASALLEVLDPHQNNTFTDHYLNVPFDLSRTLFLATANSLDTIPGPLLDRMEVIELTGYSVEQKVEIARRYLLPQQIEANGLRKDMVRVSDEALRYLIMRYTREAGVRDLERQVGALCRYVAVDVVRELDESEQKTEEDGVDRLASFDPIYIDKKMIRSILGHELVFNEVALRSSVPGVATGMSWSTAGGSILFVEASCTRRAPLNKVATSNASALTNSAPTLKLTGKLGDVMKESAQLALSWLLVNAHLIDLPRVEGSQADAGELSGPNALSLDEISSLHVHFPEGAIPKDGPSAGGAIVCALLSVISGLPVPIDIAMTGEITLRGVILPVGGIREKVLAAIRAGIKRVILPRGNKNEAEELRKEFAGVSTGSSRERDNGKDPVQLLFVSDLRELIQLVFHMKVREDVGVRRLESSNSSGGVDYTSDPVLLSML
ncbi:Lon protease 2 [Phytophthora fragariae]|uniref:Lon protease homolog n=3 Tax=Phytophthora fragariae TaxID=53985 RepID=A0A6A4A510_9STRA|nr:Lon protease 2 [Phytophthora fragariae]KAE8944055.1 Lon protease 2 [Phytophthora fragariae]KAE9014993.1 Lon protease 2 [Phytophthora fragariae]KAE9120970.1 Lon protease 2 [Phytophthora fragariae]KAE9127323.1 Lon protease 2 [Phytophthora fragariae]